MTDTANPTAQKAPKAKQTHRALMCHISKSREPAVAGLNALASKLGCGVTSLVWDAVEKYLVKPPTTAPAGATSAVGSAAGFWLFHKLNTEGRITGISIHDVASRGMLKGRMFFRYDAEDNKSKGRALRQAQKAAAYDAGIAGVKVPDGGFQPSPLPKV